VHAVRGLRQALVMLVGAGVVGLAAGAVWTAVWGGGFRSHVGVVLMEVGAVLALTGGNMLARSGSADERAFLGMAPEHEDPYSGEGLTAFGVFLFVSLPLVVAGGLLVGSG
jgi:hypothetical protein